MPSPKLMPNKWYRGMTDADLFEEYAFFRNNGVQVSLDLHAELDHRGFLHDGSRDQEYTTDYLNHIYGDYPPTDQYEMEI